MQVYRLPLEVKNNKVYNISILLLFQAVFIKFKKEKIRE